MATKSKTAPYSDFQTEDYSDQSRNQDSWTNNVLAVAAAAAFLSGGLGSGEAKSAGMPDAGSDGAGEGTDFTPVTVTNDAPIHASDDAAPPDFTPADNLSSDQSVNTDQLGGGDAAGQH